MLELTLAIQQSISPIFLPHSTQKEIIYADKRPNPSRIFDLNNFFPVYFKCF